MKTNSIFAILAVAMLLASCATTETTVTAPDGTVTVTKQTTISGTEIATGAHAVAEITNDK
jgi:hypothetical protein